MSKGKRGKAKRQAQEAREDSVFGPVQAGIVRRAVEDRIHEDERWSKRRLAMHERHLRLVK
jgi:hypothetical protein